MILKDSNGNVITTTERAIEFIVREIFEITGTTAGTLYKGGSANLSAFLRSIVERLGSVENSYVGQEVIDMINEVLENKLNKNLTNTGGELATVNDTDYVLIKKDNGMSYLISVADFISGIGNPTLFDTSYLNSPNIALEPVGAPNRIYLWRNGENTEQWYVRSVGGVLRWEKIGSITVDLSNFYNKAQVDSMFNELYSEIFNETSRVEDAMYSLWDENCTYLQMRKIAVKGDKGTGEQFYHITKAELETGLGNVFMSRNIPSTLTPTANTRFVVQQGLGTTPSYLTLLSLQGYLMNNWHSNIFMDYVAFINTLNNFPLNQTWAVLVIGPLNQVDEGIGSAIYSPINEEKWQMVTGLYTINSLIYENGDRETEINGNVYNQGTFEFQTGMSLRSRAGVPLETWGDGDNGVIFIPILKINK